MEPAKFKFHAFKKPNSRNLSGCSMNAIQYWGARIPKQYLIQEVTDN
jgi:hypothetical protein